MAQIATGAVAAAPVQPPNAQPTKGRPSVKTKKQQMLQDKRMNVGYCMDAAALQLEELLNDTRKALEANHITLHSKLPNHLRRRPRSYRNRLLPCNFKPKTMRTPALQKLRRFACCMTFLRVPALQLLRVGAPLRVRVPTPPLWSVRTGYHPVSILSGWLCSISAARNSDQRSVGCRLHAPFSDFWCRESTAVLNVHQCPGLVMDCV